MTRMLKTIGALGQIETPDEPPVFFTLNSKLKVPSALTEDEFNQALRDYALMIDPEAITTDHQDDGQVGTFFPINQVTLSEYNRNNTPQSRLEWALYMGRVVKQKLLS